MAAAVSCRPKEEGRLEHITIFGIRNTGPLSVTGKSIGTVNVIMTTAYEIETVLYSYLIYYSYRTYRANLWSLIPDFGLHYARLRALSLDYFLA